MSEAKDYLNRIKWYDVLIDSKLEEMERLNDLVRRITPSMSGAAGGGNGDKLGDTVAKIVDLQDEINRNIDDFVNLKSEASAMMEQIRQPEYYHVLHKRYVLFHTTLNLKTFDYPLTTSNAFDHICRQQTYGFA